MENNLTDLYKKLSDEELVENAKTDKAAVSELIARYLCTVEILARKYSPQNYDDLVQEGFMALLKAIKTYRTDENVKFVTYAGVCIKNKIISSLKKNQDISLIDEDELDKMMSFGSQVNPESIVIENERMEEIYKKISSALSEQEWKVFQLFLTGMAYNQMALDMGVSPKSVDNAMQRVRRKLKSVLR